MNTFIPVARRLRRALRPAVPISIYGIHMHLVHFSKPHIQRHVIRVLWMVPIYGLNAWLVRRPGFCLPALESSLASSTDVTSHPSVVPSRLQALLLGLICANEKWILMPDTVRQCYEAYTIYSFYRFVYCAPILPAPAPSATPPWLTPRLPGVLGAPSAESSIPSLPCRTVEPTPEQRTSRTGSSGPSSTCSAQSRPCVTSSRSACRSGPRPAGGSRCTAPSRGSWGPSS